MSHSSTERIQDPARRRLLAGSVAIAGAAAALPLTQARSSESPTARGGKNGA